MVEKEWMPWISIQKDPLETGESVVQRVKCGQSGHGGEQERR